jgi:2-hydroxy-3-keto-5-methylthiopentenyl-1-phosphate phosphatase
MKRIKNVKDLKRLPSGNFLDVKTRIVYAKEAIEKEFGEELEELNKPKEEVAKAVKPEAEVKPKVKTKTKNSK